MPVSRKSIVDARHQQHSLVKALDETSGLQTFVQSTSQRLKVQNDEITAGAAGTAASAQQVQVMANDGSVLRTLRCDTNGHLEVNFTNEGSLSLEATQQLVLADTNTIAGDTTSIDGKTPALGQALMAASVPVAIASDQSAIPVTSGGAALATEATLLLVEADTTTIAGAVSGTEMQVDIVDRGGVATEAKQPALGTAGTSSADVISVQGIAGMTAVVVDGSAVTQPVSAATLPLPTGASTSALQTSGNASLTDIELNTDSLAVVGGGVEATALRVTIANDSTGVLTVDDGGSSLTVDATALDIRALTNSDVVSSEQTVRPAGGSHANLWNAATPGASGKSAALDCQYASVVDLFGVVDGACTLQVEISQDNSNWIASQWSYTATGSDDFHIHLSSAARYVRLDMSAAGVQVTATGAFKA